AQARVLQADFAEYGRLQIAAFQIRARQHRAAQRGPRQIDAAQVGAFELLVSPHPLQHLISRHLTHGSLVSFSSMNRVNQAAAGWGPLSPSALSATGTTGSGAAAGSGAGAG